MQIPSGSRREHSTPHELRILVGVIPAIIAVHGMLVIGCSALSSQGTAPLPNTPVVASGLTGQLVFTRNGGLSILALDTASVREIVRSPELGQVTSARWSPDGSRLVYASAEVRNRRTPVSEIRISGGDGSGPQTILSSEASLAFGTPTWAADSLHLYLTRTGLEGGERVRRIERLNIASGRSDTIVEDVAPFDVSPDGRWLALVRAGDLGQSLILMDLHSGDARTIVREREFETIMMPRFDPSSGKVFFTAATLLSQVPAYPPGERFAAALFGLGQAYAHGLPQDVYAAPLAGGATTRLAAIKADEPAVAPSPDGGQIAILTLDGLSTMSLGGGRIATVLSPGGYGTVDWTK